MKTQSSEAAQARIAGLLRQNETLDRMLAAEQRKNAALVEALDLLLRQVDACEPFCDTFTKESRDQARAALKLAKVES